MTAPTLTEFLLARIAEDEAVARATEDAGRWSVKDYVQSGFPGEVYVVSDDGPNDAYGAVCGSESEGYHSTVDAGNAAHIARHDPARVLAECEAKRRIVEHVHFDGRSGEHFEPWCATCSDDENLVYLPCATLALLAMPYSGHPDYDEAWRP